uniref:Uncharacterized protein n=1 Tax=Triticum urartu TaxID=4572 RepID=A0A8R7Q199_TRIUA
MSSLREVIVHLYIAETMISRHHFLAHKHG